MAPKTEEIEMGQQEGPIVEREFETDDKGRIMVICVLCGEIRAYKTKGEGRCCMRTTHKWRPIAKKNRDDGAVRMPDDRSIKKRICGMCDGKGFIKITEHQTTPCSICNGRGSRNVR